jgi:hypothetical protein
MLTEANGASVVSSHRQKLQKARSDQPSRRAFSIRPGSAAANSPGSRSPAELCPECLSPVARSVLNGVGQIVPHFSQLEIRIAALIGSCRFRPLPQLSSTFSKELNFYLVLSHRAAFEVGFYDFRTGAFFARRAQLLRKRNSVMRLKHDSRQEKFR